jgi:hypothetical protein
MVITPLLRGLLGIDVRDGGTTLHLRPQLPADWDGASVQRIAAGGATYDATITRGTGRVVVEIKRSEGPRVEGSQRPGVRGSEGPGLRRIVIAPGFPLDADISAVRVNGRAVRPSLSTVGDVRFAEVEAAGGDVTRVEYTVPEQGTDAYVRHETPGPGDTSRGLRILRSRAEDGGLRLTVEGRGGHTYTLGLRTSRPVGPSTIGDVRVERRALHNPEVEVTFHGPAEEYVRRELLIPLGRGPR